MTTLVALNTRDALVMGCDSLGTMTKKLVDPFELTDFFDSDGEWKIKMDAKGKPLLENFSTIFNKAEDVPYSHMQHVDKLFSLEPLKMGIMTTGLVAIGDRSIKNLIIEFKTTDIFKRLQDGNYTIRSVARRLLTFMWKYYIEEYKDERNRPDLELMLGGYDKLKYIPGVIRIYIHQNKLIEPDYDFAIYFGGQFKEIGRLVHGTDYENRLKLARRSNELLIKYYGLLCQELKSKNISLNLKKPEEFGEELRLFHDWKIDGLDAQIAAFSEQNAIECVDFLVNVMIKSQQFSSEMPTVGGEVQLSVIKKQSGFNFVSKRVWKHGEHTVEVKE